MSRGYRRATLGGSVALPAGFGAMSRSPVAVTLHPGEIGAGLVVRRADVDRSWPVDIQHVIPAANCTAIGDPDAAVLFIEHLLAALSAGGISDALIETDGPEIPLWDGSARTIWEALQEAGRRASAEAWEPLVVTRAFEIRDGAAVVRVVPHERQALRYTLDHPHPLVGRQSFEYDSRQPFEQVAGARTFATAEELRALYGVEPTPQMETLCVVIYPDHVSDASLPEAAFARHKLVDLMGDLFVGGRYIHGRVEATASGHRHNHALLRLLLEDRESGCAPRLQ